MKKLINFTVLAIACLAVACHKNAELTTLQPVQFNKTLIASANFVKLDSTTDSTSLLTLKWNAATYPAKLAVKYTVQIDVATDTASWANAKVFAAGTNVLSTSFKGASLNSWALALGVGANDTGKLVFRVQAFEDRNVFSQAVVVSIATYVKIIVTPPPPPPPPDSLGYPVLSVPGDYQGWLPQYAGFIAKPTVYKNSVYEGFIYVPAGGTYQFKFTSEPDFNGTNYGSTATAGQLTTDGSAGNLSVPGPGFYEVSADLNALTYTATLETWAIIGDATPNGWNTETEMTYDPTVHAWKVTLNLVTAGSFKFRANNAWNIDFGIDPNTNRIFFADNPIFGTNGVFVPNALNNLTVPADGNYTVYLNLSDPNKYYYYLVKN